MQYIFFVACHYRMCYIFVPNIQWWLWDLKTRTGVMFILWSVLSTAAVAVSPYALLSSRLLSRATAGLQRNTAETVKDRQPVGGAAPRGILWISGMKSSTPPLAPHLFLFFLRSLRGEQRVRNDSQSALCLKVPVSFLYSIIPLCLILWEMSILQLKSEYDRWWKTSCHV